jgi:hypothetical protein
MKKKKTFIKACEVRETDWRRYFRKRKLDEMEN